MNEVEQAIKSHWEKWLFDLKEMINSTLKRTNRALETNQVMIKELEQVLWWVNEEINKIIEEKR
jgi:hypothetical protein